MIKIYAAKWLVVKEELVMLIDAVTEKIIMEV